MNRFFYTVLIYLATPLILLYLCYRAFKSSDYRGRISERFGFKKLQPTKPVIFVHSVSVGETIAATPLINQLVTQYPDHQVLVTTSTPTGSATVKKNFADNVLHCYLPLDLPGAVSRFLDDIKPQICIIMETELWPNLVHQLHTRQVPSLLANARMSEKSMQGYIKKAAPLMQEMLAKLDRVSAQFNSDGERFLQLGLPKEKLELGGSIKFEMTIDNELLAKQQQLKNQWAAQRPVWVAGSTHPIEHEQILASHHTLLKTIPNLLLIIVPRHPERFNDVANLCQQQGFEFIRRSDNLPPKATTQVILGDTMGELLLMYGLADVAYVGGSLITRGGHNPLEPAALGKPVVMGQSVYNFSDISERLVNANAMIQVDDSEALTSTLSQLLSEPQRCSAMGKNADQLVKANQGTLTRLLSWTKRHIGQP